MTADSHKQIKKRHGCLSGMAKEYGLKLRWRFAREVVETEVYVHPEWIKSTSTEYQAWVLITARKVPMTEADKRSAVLDSVLGQLDRHERENPPIDELPSWVPPSEYKSKGEGLIQRKRDKWNAFPSDSVSPWIHINRYYSEGS